MKIFYWSIESINSRMGLFIKASGKVLLGMAMEYKSGLMVLAMKESGKTAKLMVKGSSVIQMETHMMVSFNMTKLTDMEFILIQMESSTKVIGRMTSSMVMLLKPSQMAQGMKVTTTRARSMAKELLSGLTEIVMLEIFLITTLMVRVFIPGQMGRFMKALGKIQKNMDRVI